MFHKNGDIWEKRRKRSKEIEIKRPMCWLAIVLVLLLGLLLGGGSYEELNNLPEKTEVFIEGQVTGKEYKESDYGDYWQIVLRKVRIAEKEENTGRNSKIKSVQFLKGQYLCRIKEKDISLKIGQKVLLFGSFSPGEEATNPGQFDMKKWYCSKGILGQFVKASVKKTGEKYWPLGEVMWQVRNRVNSQLQTELGEKDGAIIAAMLLGEKSGLEEESKNLYQRNGISHVLAISGLHLMVLGMGIFTILKQIFGNNKWVAISCISLMLVYCVFVGSSISAMRATLMFIISFSAKILGRSYDSLSALGLAAVIQLFLNPYGLNNSGFRLSFLAVLGVTYVAPKLQKLFSVRRNVGKSLCVSLATSITTLPVLLVNYGTYPWYSIILNMCILPVMSILLFLAVILIVILNIPIAFGILGEIGTGFRFWELGKKIVVILIKLILDYMEVCCKLFEKFPFQDGYLGSPKVWQIVLYAILIMVVFSELCKHSLFCRKMILVSAFGVLMLSTGYGTELTMLDIGQGDGCVIRNEKGNIYISDCGSSSVSQVGKYRLIPFLKYKGYGRIKGIFISHLDKDHISGIVELLKAAKEEKIEIQYLFLAQILKENDEEELEEILLLAGQNDMKVVYLARGDTITDGKMQIQCLHPGENYKTNIAEKEKNNQSLVLMVLENNLRVLLTGDVEKDGEKEISEYVDQNGLSLNCHILKVAHHGSSGSGDERFIESVNPQVCLISAGKNNSYGHPHKETLEVLEKKDSRIFITSKTGAITIKIRRGKMFVECYLDGK